MKYAKIIGELEKLLSRERIFENEPMRKHTTIRIGGAADVFVLPLNAEELVNTVALCKKLAVPFTVLGNGSNVVVSDDGVEGVVISTSHMENKYRLTADGKLTVPSGARLAQMAQFARDRSLAGLEFAYGIPGTAGGAVYMNSGAYNREISNIVESVSCIDINGNAVKLSADECKFGYRKSVFQGTEYVITEVTLQLTQGNKELINSTMENNMQSRKESRARIKNRVFGDIRPWIQRRKQSDREVRA